MNLKQFKIIYFSLIALSLIILILLSCFKLVDTWLSSIIFIILGIDLFIYHKYWRCPHCGAHIGRDNGPRCSFCGKKLYDK